MTMGILQRDVVVAVVKTFAVALGTLLVLMTLGGGVKEGIKEGLPVPLALQTMPLLVPEMLRFIVPGCLLFAVCNVFGRRAADNEILAIKASGINPLRLVWPVLVLSYLLSVGTYMLYDVCAAWSRPNLHRLLVNSIDEIAISYLAVNRSYQKDDLSIVVKGMDGDTLLSPIIVFQPRNNEMRFTLVAQSARLSFQDETGKLRFECHNGRLEVGDDAEVFFPGDFVHEVPVVEQRERGADKLSPAALRSSLVGSQIARERRLIDELASRPRAHAEPETIAALERHRKRLYRLQAEVPRRISNGFACLGFAIIGIPVAMWSRSADTMSVFFICFLPILLVYYPLLIVGENIARGGVLPSLSVWLADTVLFVAGAGLTYKFTRH
mgnify:CR=1 FL=1